MRALLAAAALGWVGAAGAQVPVPPLTGRVVDQTGTLDAARKAALEQSLAAFEARKGTQVAVLIVPTTAPEAIEQFSIRVADQWKLGRKKVDDGAILVVAKNDRTVRIEVGYGLEGVLPDVVAKRIIDEAILPRFKSQDYAGGIAAGVDRIVHVVDGEPLPAPPEADRGTADRPAGIGGFMPIVLILALGVGGVLRSMLGRFPGALVTGGAVAVVAWVLAGALSIALIAGVIALFVTLLGGGMGRGALGGFYAGRGGGGFGGGGGGGFSGGGGGFGGGGASGKW
ncbi:MAG: YgcG family protein [Betaproteobacteria bacterium]